MEKSETQENIKIELTKAEFDLISIAIVLVHDTLCGDVQRIPETVMLARLGTRAGIFSFDTIHGLANKLKKCIEGFKE